ncbi:MAG TPA: hypothetical protein VFG20_20615 [Planctomycetaceae bacterium]|nr:hypothetical protein [Planctomycetaceae bacterium]
MARQEADREDLFAEAVTLTRRWEGTMPACSDTILAGFKTNGDSSFYFGPDRVYHFDDAGRLRRAYVAGFLYRSQGDVLSRLRRERTATETALLRSELTADESRVFRDEMTANLSQLRHAFGESTAVTLRRFPDDDVPLKADLGIMLDTIIAANPWLSPPLVRRRE